MKIKTLSVCLVLCMLISLLAACTTPSAPVTADTTAAAVTTEAAPSETTPAETTYPGPVIEEDLNGKTFRILASEPQEGYFPYSEVYYIDTAGDIINDAVFKRNTLIEEEYGITIEGVDTVQGIQGLYALQKAFNAANDDYHAASLGMKYIMLAAQQRMLANINELPYLDPDAPWYHQKMRQQLSIGDEEYMLVGFFNMRTFDTMSFIGYNRPLAEQYQLPDLNQLALDGKWTFDTMREIATSVTIDLNHDGKIDGENDQVGLLCHHGYLITFFNAMGGSFVEKDSDGLPYYVGLNERNESLLTRITDFLYDETAAVHGSVEALTYAVDPFTVNRQLFASCMVYFMRDLSATGTDYGILPYPKAGEDQEDYISTTHAVHSSAVGIPANNGDIDATAAVIAELMHRSYEIIYPAHIQRTMELRYSPEENSTEMLKMLFGTLRVEMATAMDLAVDSQLRTMGSTHMNNFTTVFKSLKQKNTALVEKYVNAFIGE